MDIRKNPLIEFFGLLNSYLYTIDDDRSKKKEKDECSLTPQPFVADTIGEIKGSISPFLEQDISLLFGSMVLSTWVLFTIIHDQGVSSIEELLAYYSSLTAKEFSLLYLHPLMMEEWYGKEIPQKALKEGLSHQFIDAPKTQEKLVGQLLREPGIWRDKIVETLRLFALHHYIPIRDRLEEEAQRRIEASERLLAEDPSRYLNTLSMGHYGKALGESPDVVLYLSVMYDCGVLVSVKRNLMIIGLGREALLTSDHQRLQTDMLFAALSDQKRLEILRVLKGREAFGNELAKHFGLTPATMSYHMSKLVRAGLVTIRIGDQNRVFYSVNTDTLRTYLESAQENLVTPDPAADSTETDRADAAQEGPEPT